MRICTRCHARGKISEDKVQAVPILNDAAKMERWMREVSAQDIDLCLPCRKALVRLVADNGFLADPSDPAPETER